MALTIATNAVVSHLSVSVARPPAAATSAKVSTAQIAAQSTAASAAGSRAQQLAALNRMSTTYTRDQSHGTDARALAALGKRITAAAKALGQHVTLPRTPTNAGAASATAEVNGAADKAKINVTT